MVSQDPHMTGLAPEPADNPQAPAGRASRGGGWRWWFEAVGPWVGVAVALAAIVLRR